MIILIKIKGTEVPFRLFLVTRHSCPGDYAARAKTSSLAAFAVIVLLDLRSSPTVLSISLLIALSKPCHPHQKQVGATYYTNIQEP